MTKRVALITGITGQVGSYLAEHLLDEGYEVHGIIRRCSLPPTGRIEHLYQDPHAIDRRLILHYGDLADVSSLGHIIDSVKPDEIYNLAAQSHVRVSFDMPEYTMDVNATAVVGLLELIRRSKHPIRFYQASSSEMFGNSPAPQNEDTPLDPQSPYACSKVAAYNLVRNYRASYGLFLCNGILFNTESQRRGITFVTKKIVRAATRIALKKEKTLYLGNLSAKRDWGHAKDYVKAIHAIVSHDKADDFVIATGETHSVEELADFAFRYYGLNWRDYVVFDENYVRPSEVHELRGDATKARTVLGWKPQYDFKQLFRELLQQEYVTESAM